MLLHCIRPHIEPLLRINQIGFRPNLGTVSQILTLRRLIESIKEKKLPAVLTFVDFRKAFDSIHREKMLQILLAYGIPLLIVNAIGVMYKNTTTRVKCPEVDPDFFSNSGSLAARRHTRAILVHCNIRLRHEKGNEQR